jgi:lambda family phage minor tail protein L
MEKIIAKDLAKQDPGSALVYLYELEYADNEFAYFHDGLDASLGEVTMLDYSNNSQTNTYKALPIEMEGLERSSATKFPAPTITFANVLSTLSVQVSDADFENFAGNRVVRRTTLRKYLKSEGDTNNPPIEYPRDVYYIDALKTRNKTALTFQLQAPFDLQGIRLPNRTIVPNRCGWIYQGASEHTENPEYKRARSGCSWNIESKYSPAYTSVLASKRRFNADGTVSSVTVNDYWQAYKTVSNPGTPTDSNNNWRRVRIYSAYSHGTSYFKYENDRYNDYTTFTDNTASTGHETYQKTLLWRVKNTNVNIPPAHGSSWERGDLCSKSLTGCGMRFGFNPNSPNSTSSVPETDFSTTVVIPFGGFPGSKSFS